MAFELEDITTLKLTSVNPRKEHHGDELVQAIDLNVRWETSNEALTMFDPWLRGALFYNAAADQGQGDLTCVPEVWPNLRMTKLVTPLKWDWEGVGYTMRIDHGLGGKSDLVLTGCKVKKFAITPKEGGTTFIDFQVQANVDVTKKLVGELCDLEGAEIAASLMAPNEVPGGVIDGTKGHPGAGAPTDGLAEGAAAGQQPLDATDAFVATHGEATA